jgi:hypothetical protein
LGASCRNYRAEQRELSDRLLLELTGQEKTKLLTEKIANAHEAKKRMTSDGKTALLDICALKSRYNGQCAANGQ